MTVEDGPGGSNDIIRFYIDGQPAGTGTNTAEAADGDWILGAANSYGGMLIGALDEVAIYTKELSPARIAAHYQKLVPFVDITNANTSVSDIVTAYTITGTNNAWVAGTMSWTNAATGGTAVFPAVSPWTVTNIPLAIGANLISVSGTNAFGLTASDSVTITRDPIHTGVSPIHYVSAAGAAIWPYTNWMDAATSIQDAVDAASSNDAVLVTNGTYTSASEITVAKAITVESVNGRDVTIVDGENAHRCFHLGNYACTISGFTITNGNTGGSSKGGGVYCSTATPVITNCTLSGNSAAYDGGGSYYGTLNNCTISGNEAIYGGGGSYYGTLRNCIIFGNDGPNYFSGSITNSCSPGLTGTGNITNDPQFVNVPGGNYRLLQSSPCRDAGNNGYVSGSTDLDGNPRIANGTVDMGAYEYLAGEHTGASPIHYVSTNSPNALWPYTNWATASRLIQDAVDGAQAGDMVLVSNGVYTTAAEIVVANPIVLASVNGPEVTTVDAQSTHRCFNLGTNATELRGLTIANGASPVGGDGGGVLCGDATPLLSHCIVRGNSATNSGGGVKRGTLRHCLVHDNTANLGGGLSDSIAAHSTISDNSANVAGGVSAGTLTNCIVWSNSADSFSDVQSAAAAYSCSPDLAHGVGGNITNTPLFVSAAASNFQLQAASPGIDGGTDLGATNDLADTPCPLDGDANGSAIPDMGAYEHLNTSADSDGDGLTDGEERDTYNTSFVNTDTDGDGEDDGDEVDWGFDPTVDNSIGFSHFENLGESNVTSNPAAYGLYTSNSIMDLSMGYLMLQTTSNDQMRLWLQLEESTNLTGGVWSNAGDAVEWLRSVPTNKAFYRVHGRE